MICPTTNAEQTQFTYRGITVNRSAAGSKMERWAAEIRRGRGYEFVRAESVAEMRQQIDAALARRPAD
jgi:hypothetical protein